jgi:hypothetical protein
MIADVGFVALTFFNILASVILFCGLLSDRLRLYPVWHKIGLLLAVVGLLSQVFRNIIYLGTGVSPSDATLPLWACKDIGIDIIAFYYFSKAVERFLDKKQAVVVPDKMLKAVKPTPVRKPRAKKEIGK